MAPQTTVWDKLSELVTSDEGKRELATLRSAYVDITQKLNKMAAVRRWARELSSCTQLVALKPAATVRSCPLECFSEQICIIFVQPQPAINWAQWSKEIDPKLVDQFKQTFESERAAFGGTNFGYLYHSGYPPAQGRASRPSCLTPGLLAENDRD